MATLNEMNWYNKPTKRTLISGTLAGISIITFVVWDKINFPTGNLLSWKYLPVYVILFFVLSAMIKLYRNYTRNNKSGK